MTKIHLVQVYETKLKRRGVAVVHEPDLVMLPDFQSVYELTLKAIENYRTETTII